MPTPQKFSKGNDEKKVTRQKLIKAKGNAARQALPVELLKRML
jgi:hypothetical protein